MAKKHIPRKPPKQDSSRPFPVFVCVRERAVLKRGQHGKTAQRCTAGEGEQEKRRERERVSLFKARREKHASHNASHMSSKFKLISGSDITSYIKQETHDDYK